MFLPSDIHTIKLTDAWIYEGQASQIIAESKFRRNSDVEHLTCLLPVRQRELIAEQQKISPDMERIAILHRIVSDLQRTIKSVQR